MRKSLDDFRGERADPARLEAAVKAGVDAARVFDLVAPDGQKDEALQAGPRGRRDEPAGSGGSPSRPPSRTRG